MGTKTYKKCTIKNSMGHYAPFVGGNYARSSQLFKSGFTGF